MISVIVPTYNSEGTVASCLNSILNQRKTDECEVIVVDDGSTDKTTDIVRNYPVKLLEQGHRGPASARNLGAKEARGEILLFTDADCEPSEGWLAEMITPLKGDVVGVQGRYITKQKELIARFVQYEIEERYERMLRGAYIDFIGSYSAAYRRDVFIQIGGFDESFSTASGEDPDLSYRLDSMGKKMVFNPKAIVYHAHDDSLKEYMVKKFYRAYWRVPLYRKHRVKMRRDSYTPQTLKFQILVIFLAPLAIAAGFFTRSYLFLTGGALLASALPLTLTIIKKDFSVGLISPFMIFLRAFAFSLGLVYGVVHPPKR